VGALKVTQPPLKNANFDQYLLIKSEPHKLVKNVQLSRIEVDHALSNEL